MSRGPGMLLSLLKCTGQCLTTKNCLAEMLTVPKLRHPALNTHWWYWFIHVSKKKKNFTTVIGVKFEAWDWLSASVWAGLTNVWVTPRSQMPSEAHLAFLPRFLSCHFVLSSLGLANLEPSFHTQPVLSGPWREWPWMSWMLLLLKCQTELFCG